MPFIDNVRITVALTADEEEGLLATIARLGQTIRHLEATVNQQTHVIHGKDEQLAELTAKVNEIETAIAEMQPATQTEPEVS